MIGKKINQLATELAPVSTDLTIIGNPISGVSKKITLAQLGAIFSGAVSFYTDLASFPATGDINVIYCAKDTQKLYLWSGSAYTEVFPSQALLDTYQLRSEKGNANGYASLDSGGKVPISQLPSSIMEYKGTWSASTNTPTLANGTGDTGDVYICNSPGTVNFGAGGITFAVGDYVIYSGSIWQRSSGAVGTVTSVALTVGGDAISVSGSPLTTSGTLGLTFNGTTAQYIRGNGTLETFPTSLISGTGNVNAIPKFTANTVLGNSVMEDDGNFVSMRGLKLNLIAGTGNSINFQQASGIIAAGLGYSSIGAASSTGIKFYLDQNVTTRSFVLDTTTITSDTERTYSMPNSSGTLALTSDIPSLTGYVPYTGATTNLDLGTHTLSAYDLIIDHTSGSGVAASITKGGNGEALTVVKSSGSGNAASITGGVTLLSELHLTTDLADAYIASATNWNTAYSLRITSATSPLSITSNVISIAQASGSTDGYLSSTDWTTFNNKQNALTNPVTGTGTTNYLPKFTGASTIGNSQIFDNGTNIGLGVANPTAGRLQINVSDTTTAAHLQIVDGTTTLANSFVTNFRNANDGNGRYSLSSWQVQNAVGNDQNGFIGVQSVSGAGAYTPNIVFGQRTGASTYATRMTLDASGNLGLGVTPSAWFTSAKAIQVLGAALEGRTTVTQLWCNGYVDAGASGNFYQYNGFASKYTQVNSEHQWFTAPSGTAGNAISFTQAMTLDASGRLGIGTTSPSERLDVSGVLRVVMPNDPLTGAITAKILSFASNPFGLVFRGYETGAHSIQSQRENNDAQLYALSLQPLGGNVGIGSATPGYKFTVGIDVETSTMQTYANGTSGASQGGVIRSWTYSTENFARYTDIVSIGNWDGTNGKSVMRFFTQDASTSPAERMRITSAGKVLIGKTSASAVARNLEVQGQVAATAGSVITEIDSYAVGGTNLGFIGTQSNHDLVIKTNDTERMRITSGGNVGIGTTSTSYKLEVAGVVRIQDTLSISNGESGQAIFTNNSTAVSVSTTTALGGSFSMGGNGAFVIVYGASGSNVFIDTIIAGNTGTPTVLSSTIVSGLPSLRTYSTGSNRLQLAMASGTYDVRINILRQT
jgi:hypothetical protein